MLGQARSRSTSTKMNGPLALLVCVISSVLGDTRVPPVFNRRYSTKGFLYIPSDIKVVEPFEAWYDGINNKSRIDYHKGALKTFQFPGEGQHGTGYKVVTRRSYIFQSKSTCEKLDGTTSNPVTQQGLLPNIDGFQFLKEKMIDGKLVERWERIEDSRDVFSTHTMWVRYKRYLREAIPVRYEVKRHNKILNDTIDKFSWNFTQYSTNLSNGTVFRLPIDRTLCKDVDITELSKLDMNPMLEFMHGKNSHLLEAFKKFKHDFKKTYSNPEEELRRFNYFKKNYRFILTTNRANRSYQLDVNRFTDLNTDELNQMILQKKKASL